MVQLCSSNAERLTKLVNDVLDVERMRAGALELSRRQVKLHDVLEAAGDAVEPLAGPAEVRIEVLPACGTAFIDPERIEQVLIQLLSNAIKFSPPGSVVQVRSAFESRQWHIEIEDHGRGIPADHLTRIFEPFHQVDAGDARATGGSGLGLPICQYIVERHGGRIWAQSGPGRGTTFHVELPLGPPPAGAASD
jgi:signal transduction histidine kinase